MFLSVIIPVYNVERYLSQCLDSVLKQSFKDYEIILVDDGSSDSCPELCDSYAAGNENIRVIHKKNGGLSSARNAGLRIAQGNYVYFLDSDDYLLNEDFFHRVFEFSKSGPDIITFKHIRFFENHNSYSDCNYDYKIQCNTFGSIAKELVEKDAFFGMAWIKVVKKSILTNNRITFVEGLLGEDMPWNLELYLNSESIYLMDSIEYVYRQRDNSITTTTKLKNLTDFIGILEQKYPLVLEAKCNDELKTALLGALAKYYSNLLITYVRVSDKQKEASLERIKKLSFLLKYSLSSRPKNIRAVYNLFGIRATLFLLKLLDGKRK